MQFNYLGTNADGDDLGNNLGIRILRAASGAELKVIVDSNVIGFSSFSGIEVTPRSFTDINGVEIIRNRIGIHPSEQPIPNKDGILMQATSAGSILNCIVGHSITSNITTGSLGNDIAFNTQSAVVLKTGAGTPPRQITIRGNRIFGNAKGINLGPGGDTVDPDDFDTGPNELQNYPEFDSDQTFIDSTTGDLHYRLRVQTSAGIQGAYPLLIDFYLADGQLAQGKEYLGTVLYEEQDAQEWVTGSLTPVIPVSVTGRFLVATASRRNDILFGPTVGETSEFNAQAVSLEPDLPLLELQPEALDFGEQAVGTPISASFLIRNSGAADLVLGSFAISGPQAGDFSIIAPNNCDGATIAVGLSCIVEVAFSPLQEGVRRAEVTIPSNDPNGPHSLDLTGGSGDPIFVDSFESR